MRLPRAAWLPKALLPIALVLAGFLSACGGSSAGDPSDDSPADSDATSPQAKPQIAELQYADTLVAGSWIRVRGPGLDVFGPSASLQFGDTAVALALIEQVGSELTFLLDAPNANALGEGPWSGALHVVEGNRVSEERQVTLLLARTLAPQLSDAGETTVHRYDGWIVRGDGVLQPDEGQNFLDFSGTYTPKGGESAALTTTLEAAPAELFSRDRALAVLDTSFGGLTEGTFEGEVVLRTRNAAGEEQSSGSLPVLLNFVRPEIYAVSPVSMQLGQIVEIRGAGFVSGEGSGSGEGQGELTTFRLQGLYTDEADESGESSSAKVDVTLVPTEAFGDVARFVLRADVVDDRLGTALFGRRGGVFDGEITAVTSDATHELASDPAATAWQIRTRGQVVHVRFLPGFDDSVPLFGLGGLEPEVKKAVRDAIEELYEPYRLDVRLDAPEDIDVNHYSVVEIGGADPNGIGLFGFDNSPGKDINNLRLFDAVGGANAETQADGFPGYGGVFIEAFLYFSAHPPLEGPRPLTAPPPEPLFDLVFDPVRDQPGTLAEFQGVGERERVEAVQRAVRTLGRIVGETTAHEIGHSLGLADPYGPENTFHNPTDGPGCLMDEGSHRPFDERAQGQGAAEVGLCYGHPAYLLHILGPR